MQQVAQLGEIDYIPVDLQDCFDHLKLLLPAKDLEHLKSVPESAVYTYHFNWGMSIRNKWGLWDNSRLAQWFIGQDIHHADDMSGIILTSFWRHLNNQPIRLDEQVRFYQKYWDQSNG